MRNQDKKDKTGSQEKTFPFGSSEYPLPLAWIGRHRTIRVYRAEFQLNRHHRFGFEELVLRGNRVRSARNFNRIFEDMAESWAALYGPDSYHVRLARQAAHIATMMAEYRLRELLELFEDEE